MSLLGRLFAKRLCTFKFEFDPNFEGNSLVSIVEDSALPSEYQACVWALYYAKTLYTLGNSETSKGLKNHIEQWAEPIIAGLGFPLKTAEEMGLLVLDKEMQLVKAKLSGANGETYVLKVYKARNGWPSIQTDIPLQGYQNRLAYSVVALGQYFINKRKEFAREMASDALSMRKYYKEVRPFTDIKSTTEAPAFAIKESIEMFDEFAKELDSLEKELE